MARISSSSSSTNTPDSFSAGTPGQIDIGITSIQVFAANPNRKYVYISNNTQNTIFIQYSNPAVLNTGIKIPPNTLYTIETNNLWLGIVNAIGNQTSTLIDIFEGE